MPVLLFPLSTTYEQNQLQVSKLSFPHIPLISSSTALVSEGNVQLRLLQAIKEQRCLSGLLYLEQEDDDQARGVFTRA